MLKWILKRQFLVEVSILSLHGLLLVGQGLHAEVQRDIVLNKKEENERG